MQLANNHILDQGDEGLLQTISELQENAITFIGAGKNMAQAWDYTVIEDGKVALIAASYTCYNDRNTKDCSTVARISDDKAHLRNTLRRIKLFHPQAAIGILVHLGLEYDPLASLYQQEVARGYLDEGVDFYIGAHAHVVQEFEIYKGKPIFYGLGNAVFD